MRCGLSPNSSPNAEDMLPQRKRARNGRSRANLKSLKESFEYKVISVSDVGISFLLSESCIER